MHCYGKIFIVIFLDTKMDMKLIILGPPGSGKGTVSEKLSKKFKLFHLSAGEILREEVDKKTQLGKEIRLFIDKGNLVPAKLVVELVKLEIGNKKDYLLDGFPRSLDQAKEIKSLDIDAAIYLDLPEKAIIERLSERRLDPVTGGTYHLKYLPPPEKIRKRLILRKDDRPQIIKQRLKVYQQETKPVIGYYRKKGSLRKVDAGGSPKEVYEKVERIVKQLSA